MTPELVVPTALAVLAVLVLVGLVGAVALLVLAVRRTRERTDALLAGAATDADELREQLTHIEEQLRAQAAAVERAGLADRPPVLVDDREFIITELGRERPLVPGIPAPQFVDTLLRESLVRTASLAAGLRHALSPEIRNRIRFEMKREVKRSRKQRRAEARLARREWEARQRAGIELTG
ncbi:MAG: hypothetical protein FWE71_07220 [Nocardioidaceae bacterium]|nr:hypothetical protein [Nocardioidaceae bacterium]MCL2612242.1 hypothetical protein [Nocardioidaceae bacterium]